MHIRTPQRYNGGQAFILAIVFLILISLGGMTAMLFPLVHDISSVREAQLGTRAYFVAEALVEDLVYRSKVGISTDAEEELTLDGYTAASTESANPSGKLFTVTGDAEGRIRKIQAALNIGEGATFNYGVQTGNGGFYLSNGAGVAGNVYSNGDIIGNNGAYVTGTAIAANTAALVSDQSNTTPLPPTQNLIFGTTTIREDIAQSFQVSTTSPINKIRVYMKKSGNPSDLTARITTDNAGSPSTNTLVSGNLSSSLVSGVYGWIEVVFATNPQLTKNTTYWLVLDGASSASKYYIIGGNTGYANGSGKSGQYSNGTWTTTSPSGQDIYFDVYLGGLTAKINNIAVGENGVGNAYAHTVTNTTVAGSLYCQTGSGNNKACNTSLADPTPVGFPISDGNIAQWKQDAQDGDYIEGDYTISGKKEVLGPVKIHGNLTMDNQASTTMTGNIWVTGKIHFRNGSYVKLDPSYGHNSGIIIADGPIDFDNSGAFQGSGQSGSYILVLTTSDCPTSSSCSGAYAITTGNGTGNALLNAQQGTINIGNNVNIKEITAYKILVGQGTRVTYELGLANVNFVSGPTGAFGITGWREVQ